MGESCITIKRDCSHFVQSVIIHFITYEGKGKLIALVAEDIVPDPLQLCQDCADALQLMKQAADVTSMHSSWYRERMIGKSMSMLKRAFENYYEVQPLKDIERSVLNRL